MFERTYIIKFEASVHSLMPAVNCKPRVKGNKILKEIKYPELIHAPFI